MGSGNAENITALRASIAELDAKLTHDHRNLREERTAAENELALLTAVLFIAIDNGKNPKVLPISPEIKRTRFDGLTFKLLPELPAVSVSCGFDHSSVEFSFLRGQGLRFVIEDREDEPSTITYTLKVFGTHDEAHAWLRGRLIDSSQTLADE